VLEAHPAAEFGDRRRAARPEQWADPTGNDAVRHAGVDRAVEQLPGVDTLTAVELAVVRGRASGLPMAQIARSAALSVRGAEAALLRARKKLEKSPT
jgi:DNA-binding CsgD family transcriptional regulator